MPDITLPSGKTITGRMFAFDAAAFEHWIRRNYGETNSLVTLRHPNGTLFAIASHEQGVLDGVTFAMYDSLAPMVHATYKDGRRDGTLRTWDESGRRVYWCEYTKGKRNGLCCYFDTGVLRLILECSFDSMTAIHLIEAGKVVKSFEEEAAATADPLAGPALSELGKIEAQLADNERRFKRVVKSEDLALRQKRVSQLNPQRRAAMQDRINQRGAERDAMIGALRRRAGF